MQSPERSSLGTRPEDQIPGEFPQQLQIVKTNSGSCLAFAGVACAELVCDLSSAANAPADQDFQQQLEPLGFKAETLDRFAPHNEEARHRILHAQVSSLEGKRSPCADARNRRADGIPVPDPVL